ncbi:MAG: class II D-tagatose-bisphosphate aldolase, non-catalytic subunit [Acidobacteria bacterium]|nr:class II D-tagatose-bisphosphate aldolase, non-catalytic subunit [Acidobacteriota bacterium]
MQETIRRNRSSETVGVYAVCSAHPWVIAAGARESRENRSVLHIESTSSQVNQFGGYTGQNPEQFCKFVRQLARDAGLSHEQILLGGDHLGPFPWRSKTASTAMANAHGLVRACVLAGYQKIHLDASMACADDHSLDERTVAHRAAELCATAESAFRELPLDSPPLLYVVGTEVPVPGGESGWQESISVTAATHVESTLDAFKNAFDELGLEDAWERVIGLVVQPGVEFGESHVLDYNRRKAQGLRAALPASPKLVYEAHSTDYQLPLSLERMVEDHFAILKVGPELTFAFREVVFGLSAIEQEMLRGKAARVSTVREALEAAMLRNPSYWRDYYHGDETQLHIARCYSYSDRCRYYWHEPEINEQIDLLIENLTALAPAFTLVSQYLPLEYAAIRAGRLQASPSEMISHHIRTVLHKYATACGDNR